MPPVARTDWSSILPPMDWAVNSNDPVDRAMAAYVLSVNPILRAYEATIEDVDRAHKSVVGKINTGALDRYKTVIFPEGLTLNNYRSNPVVLWEHSKDPQRGSLPIGKNQWIKPGGGGNGMIVAKTAFNQMFGTKPDDYSMCLFDMYEDGTLRGWSVNVLPDNKRCSPPTKEEIRARPELSECIMMYRSGDLAEYSGVAVPGNAETLSILAERGIWCPRATESQGLGAGGASVAPGTPDSDSLPRKKGRKRKRQPSTQVSDLALTGPADNPVPGRTPRYIKHEGSKWNVYSESGKKLGSHDSEGDAKKQLFAIEANKHSGRSITESDGIFQVRTGSQMILETASKAVAEETLAALDAPLKTWSDEWIRLVEQQRSWQVQMERNTNALLDLFKTGRV